MCIFKKVVIFLSVVLCFYGDCMKSVSIAVQGVGTKDLTATVERRDETAPIISLRTIEETNASSIHLTDGVFGIILTAPSFDSQGIDIKDGQNTIFRILIEKPNEYGQPVVKLSNIQDIMCALYRRCSGGGNAFVLAIGSTPQEISLQSVQAHQLLGKMQAFVRVNNL